MSAFIYLSLFVTSMGYCTQPVTVFNKFFLHHYMLELPQIVLGCRYAFMYGLSAVHLSNKFVFVRLIIVILSVR